MKISGFTIIRNGVEFDYPFRESIASLLPLVDELVILVGRSSDSTLSEIKKLGGSKLNIIESDWPLSDASQMRGGQILAQQTNAALSHCVGDWCVYLQADEVLHESEIPLIRSSIERTHQNPSIEGLLFDYVHFYGSYDVIQDTRSAYRREVRAIRRSAEPVSVGDAQSFRKSNGSKLAVQHSGAHVYHYGWVRNPQAMRDKTFFLDQLYHGVSPSAQELPHSGTNYLYKRFWGLKKFSGSHPAVMRERIATKNWNWNWEQSPYVFSFSDLKKVISDGIEKCTGIRPFEYRSYRLMR